MRGRGEYLDVGENMTKEEVIKLVESTNWYHAFEIFPGVTTLGQCKCNPEIALNNIGVPKDLRGLKVLDIGAWDGPYTFEAERRGADVTALDIQDPNRTGFNIASKIKKSKAKYIVSSVYDMLPDRHRTYDMVFFFGVYYHLKKPLLALENIYNVLNAEGIMFFEGAIFDYSYNVDDALKEHKKLIKQMTNISISYFTSKSYSNEKSNWFVPNCLCLEEWLTATGFHDIKSSTEIETSRVYGSCKKKPDFSEVEHGLV